jgi:uncharacterized protein YjbI with pentapeptide repeats
MRNGFIHLQRVLRPLVASLAAFLISCSCCGITSGIGGVSSTRILREIDAGEDVHYEGMTIVGRLDFTELTDNTIRASLELVDCTLRGDVIATGTRFEQKVAFAGSVIEETTPTLGGDRTGKVDFSRAWFVSDADFSGVSFPGPFVHFDEARFDGNANFDGAQFQDFVWFNHAQIHGISSFVGAQFQHAEFRSTRFTSVASFEDADFDGYADLYSAEFLNDAIFDETAFHAGGGFDTVTFGEDVAFRSAQFSGGATFENARFDGFADFHAARFVSYANFDGAVFESGAGFDQATLNGDPFRPENHSED